MVMVRHFPVWMDEDQRDDLLADLLNVGSEAARRRSLTGDELTALGTRARLTLVSGMICGCFKRFQTPTHKPWEDVAFRLSVGEKMVH